MNEYYWIITILEELSITYDDFIKMNDGLSKDVVENYLRGKITDVEKRNLIRSLNK